MSAQVVVHDTEIRFLPVELVPVTFAVFLLLHDPFPAAIGTSLRPVGKTLTLLSLIQPILQLHAPESHT